MIFRRFRPLLALACVLVFGAASLGAGTPPTQRVGLQSGTPASIELAPVAAQWDGSGFMPVRVRIENHGSRSLAWDFAFTVNVGYAGHSLTCERTLEAEAGRVLETVVYVPGALLVPSGQHLNLVVDVSGPGAVSYRTFLMHGGSDPVISTATTSVLEGALFNVLHGAPGVKTEITAVEPARWPADWRVWSPFRRVVLRQADFAALDGARRAALHDWVAMGGVLDLYAAGPGEEPGARPHGHGTIRALRHTLEQEKADPALQPGLPGPTLPESLARERGVSIPAERVASLRPARGTVGVALFLLGFGLLIGPINLFVFAPSSRRHRLFLTVPVISLGASLLLVVYIVLKDGFGGEGARHGVVLLLPASNQAVVEQTQMARTGVLLGGGFELPDDVALQRLNAPGGHWHGGAFSERAEHYLRRPGRAGGDWFASRRVQEHSLRRLVPTRARVELVAGGAGEEPPVVQSSVGTVLRDFLYVDAQARIWSAEELAPGTRVTLRRKPNFAGPGGLGRGSFTARGGAAEGLTPIDTLPSIRWDDAQFLYAGPVVGARNS